MAAAAAEKTASRASGVALDKPSAPYPPRRLHYACSMRGAVAAGHPLTAEAGAQVLREGGNAVDACIAAAAMSWVAESPLPGPGAGGVMLVPPPAATPTGAPDHLLTLPGAG